MILLIMHLFNVDIFGESSKERPETNAVALWLILTLLGLTILLAYVSLSDFGKRSLVKIRIKSSPLGIFLAITNVSKEEQCFSGFELQFLKRNKEFVSSEKFHLKEELKIASNKKWTNQLDFSSLIGQDKPDESVEWMRIKISGINGINYFSNKLRLT